MGDVGNEKLLRRVGLSWHYYKLPSNKECVHKEGKTEACICIRIHIPAALFHRCKWLRVDEQGRGANETDRCCIGYS